MSERFEWKTTSSGLLQIIDNETGKETFNTQDIVDLLNEMDKKNKSLSRRNKKIKRRLLDSIQENRRRF